MTAIGRDATPDSGQGQTPPAQRPPAARGFERVRSSVVMRFASVGVLNTAVDFGVYVALFALGMSSFPANFLSTSAGLAVSFLGNSRYVFRSPRTRPREVTLFLLTAGFGIWLIQPLVIEALTALAGHLGWERSTLLGAAAKLVAIAVAAVWNYTMYSRVVFRHHSDPRKDVPAA
jgi:putative flippase GtrA